jgi:uncharacterized protein YegL
MPAFELDSNPNQRTLCILVLDASGSMGFSTGSVRPIDQLNDGLKLLEMELKRDEIARERVCLSIVIVGGPNDDAEVLMDWTDIENFSSFEVSANNTTPLGKGMLLSLDRIEEGKRELREHGISYLKPWIMVITDGQPTDNQTWNLAIQNCREAEQNGKCIIYPIAVNGADDTELQKISHSQVQSMSSVKFPELFQWLSSSLSTVSRSAPGDDIDLPSTDPWSSVQL